jgi:hypothetical protein
MLESMSLTTGQASIVTDVNTGGADADVAGGADGDARSMDDDTRGAAQCTYVFFVHCLQACKHL